MIKYFERFNESDKPVKFAVFVPGTDEPVFQAEIPRDAPMPPPEGVDSAETRVSFNLIAQFRDFLIGEAGAIKVRAYRGDDEIHLGSLRVKLNPKAAGSTACRGVSGAIKQTAAA